MTMEVETIVLRGIGFTDNSSEMEPPKPSRRNVQFEIEHTTYDKKCRLSLFSFRYIEQIEGLRGNHSNTDSADPLRQIAYHMGFLHSEPEIVNYKRPTYLIVSLLLLLASTIVTTLMLDNSIGGAITLGLSAIPLIAYGLSTRQCTIFYTKIARVPVLTIDTTTMNQCLVSTLIGNIQHGIAQNPLPAEINLLAEETKLLRNFMLKGFITEREYLDARDKIFKKYPSPNKTISP